MHIDAVSKDGIMILTVRAERIDAASAVQLKNQFRDLIADWNGRIVMDLEEVKFMDSSGLGAMVAALKLSGSRKLELAQLSKTVGKVFTLTRMDKVFTIHSDVETALKYCEGEMNHQAG